MPVKPDALADRRLVGRRRGAPSPRGVVLDRAGAVVQALEELAQRLGGGRRLGRERAQLGDLLAGPRLKARVPTLPTPAERANGGPRGLGERAEAVEEGGQVGRRALQVAEQRRLRVGELPQAAHRRARARRGSRAACWKFCAQLGAAGGGDLRRVARPRAPSAPRPACCAPARDHRSESAMNFSMVRFWSPRMRSALRGLAQARVGAAQHRLRGPPGGPARPAPSEEMISRSRSRYGRAQDVVDQVLRDRRGGLLDRDDAAAVAGQLARACRPAGSRRSTRRSATAA